MSEVKTLVKATHRGTLFDGAIDCYVLEDGTRVISQRGVVKALTGSANGSAPLGQYLARLPGKFQGLAAQTVLEFSTPTGPAKGRSAEWVSDLLDAYIDSFMAGELHTQQAHLAINARKIQSAAQKIGWIALIDEATGYQEQRSSTELAFIHRAFLRDDKSDWERMWGFGVTEALCLLHRVRHIEGNRMPRMLASTFDKIYRLILGNEIVDEMKRRNPSPQYGSNHHQWLTPEARQVVSEEMPIITVLARQSANKDDFWNRAEHHYKQTPLQLGFHPKPPRGKA